MGLFELVGGFLHDYGGHIGIASGIGLGVALTRLRAIERTSKAFGVLLREMRVFPDVSDETLKPNPLLPLKRYIDDTATNLRARLKATERPDVNELLRRLDGAQLDFIARRIEERGARTTLPDESTAGRLASLEKRLQDLRKEFEAHRDESRQERHDDRKEREKEWKTMQRDLGDIERTLRKWDPQP